MGGEAVQVDVRLGKDEKDWEGFEQGVCSHGLRKSHSDQRHRTATAAESRL
jgi:hypothetical protein